MDMEKLSRDRSEEYLLLAEKELNKTKRQYLLSLAEIEKELSKFYARYAAENQVSLAEAQKVLNSGELKEFRLSLEEYLDMAKNNADGRYSRQLANLSKKVQITRLQALQAQIQMLLDQMYEKYQGQAAEFLGSTYEANYYRSIYEINSKLGIGVDFALLNPELVEKAVNFPWSGMSFSARIWGQKDRLVANMQNVISQGLIQGKSIHKMTADISRRMEVGYADAHRLIMTETSRVLNQGTLDGYRKSQVVEMYEYLAELDIYTSDICRALDGKKFKISEAEIGSNYPPAHPNCRSTTVAYFDDDIAARVARDFTGQTYNVPAGMKYQEWYDTYVKDQVSVWLREQSPKAQEKFLQGKQKRILFQAGILQEKDFHRSLQELQNNGIMTLTDGTVKHASQGTFTEISHRLKEGGHGQSSLVYMKKHGIEYNVVKTFSNGVRAGNVPTHKVKQKRVGDSQSWFPESWDDEKIQIAGTYVANQRKPGERKIFAVYENVKVGVILDENDKVTTVFPDSSQDHLDE
jgi:SPP1 gp7 family putative phage head morphogenesis protein